MTQNQNDGPAKEAKYRAEAKRALERASELLASTSPNDLRYAALELRYALEALVMGRAATFRDEMGERFMDNWNPRTVFGHLRDIDSMIDGPTTLQVDTGKDGVPDWKTLGVHHFLSFRELDKLHNSLGYFLHAPSIKQFESEGFLNEDKLRRRCQGAVEAISATLNSTLSSLKIKFWAFTFDCERCQADNQVVNLHPGETRLVACHNCSAPYKLEGGHDDAARVSPYRKPITCAEAHCDHKKYFWTDEIRAASKWQGKDLKGLKWTCANGHVNVVVLTNRREVDVL